MIYSIIVAVDLNKGISKNGQIPWYSKQDMKYFKDITIGNINNTKQNVVIMGRKTYESIGKSLKNRINIVLTRNTNYNNINNNLIIKYDIINVIEYIENNNTNINEIFVIGGSEIYEQFFKLKIINYIYITHICKIFNHKCDKFFPIDYLSQFQLIDKSDQIKENDNVIEFQKYKYFNKEEFKYLKLMKNILNNGFQRPDRTGIGSLSLFGKSLKYDVRNGRIPLLTTKKVFLRGIIEELLLFISGKTDSNILSNKNVNIWKGNTSRDFLDSVGLNHLKIGDMGAAYPFQLRHWNTDYENYDTDYTGKGFDQLEYIINLIKTEPNSRRILFSYWNPSYLKQTCLPSCHVMYLYYVNTELNEISCSFVMRSNDEFHGAPFNIVSATILLYMICYITGYKPGDVVHMTNDCHIYNTHIEQCKEQLTREPYNFPLLIIKDEDKEIKKMEDFKYENFKLLNYNHHPAIKAKMVA